MATSFGDLLRQFRIATNLTQEALAERAAISPFTAPAIKQGRRRAQHLSTVARIADCLQLSSLGRAVLG